MGEGLEEGLPSCDRSKPNIRLQGYMKFIQRRTERRKKVLMTLCAYEWQELFIAGVGLSINKDLRWKKKTEGRR